MAYVSINCIISYLGFYIQDEISGECVKRGGYDQLEFRKNTECLKFKVSLINNLVNAIGKCVYSHPSIKNLRLTNCAQKQILLKEQHDLYDIPGNSWIKRKTANPHLYTGGTSRINSIRAIYETSFGLTLPASGTLLMHMYRFVRNILCSIHNFIFLIFLLQYLTVALQTSNSFVRSLTH